LSFYEPELAALKGIMNDGDPEELVFGGCKFYCGKIGNAEVVATLTGVSISNAAMTTALMIQLYPGVESIIGGGIAGRVDPKLRVGGVVIPERWALYQMQVYSRETEDGYLPVDFEQDLLVGKDCGGFDGVDRFLAGDGPCDWTTGEASNFGFMFPKTVQRPDPNEPDPVKQISEVKLAM
jgi:nucleoside phosphorylase